jgi:hypothetical protein
MQLWAQGKAASAWRLEKAAWVCPRETGMRQGMRQEGLREGQQATRMRLSCCQLKRLSLELRQAMLTETAFSQSALLWHPAWPAWKLPGHPVWPSWKLPWPPRLAPCGVSSLQRPAASVTSSRVGRLFRATECVDTRRTSRRATAQCCRQPSSPLSCQQTTRVCARLLTSSPRQRERAVRRKLRHRCRQKGHHR